LRSNPSANGVRQIVDICDSCVSGTVPVEIKLGPTTPVADGYMNQSIT